MKPRRFFKITDINLMREWAADGKSQSYAAKQLNRDPGVIAQAAIRYGIQFNAKSGSPIRTTIQHRRKMKAANCARFRRKRGAKPNPRMARIQISVVRFDDPRVMA
jgi:hypothetical protein